MCQIPRMCTFLLATRAGVLCGPRAPEAGSLLLLRGSYWSISTYLCADLRGGDAVYSGRDGLVAFFSSLLTYGLS